MRNTNNINDNRELFNKLVKEAYELSKNSHLIGICHTACSSVGFSEITDDKIDNFVNNQSIEMLFLKSKATGVEIQLYPYEFKNYKVSHSAEILYILTNKGEIALMY